MSAEQSSSSLKQFNETQGSLRFELAMKKASGSFMSASELSTLTQLNECYRSLLSDRMTDDDRFLQKFVKDFGLFDGEAPKKQSKKKTRNQTAR